ncbi:unnamed protein product [marine sediment metagenome]|uniref:Uncharacterized protein n=1 Tax=marine sediment metagenome TaxID=412755 RepID=X1D992_9ZZZZ
MPIRTARPYAAKAIVEHEFDTDHLNIFVTFRFTMDQTVKPDNEVWLVEVDDVPKAVTVSAWQDAWTMLLTVPDVVVLPDRVTLEYDGPDPLLRITWYKQWEPWGPIVSIELPPVSTTRTFSTGPAQQDNVDVSNVNILFLDCAANDITISGFVGGVNGQVLHIARLCAAVNDATLLHNDGSSTQKILLHKGLDETLTGEYGGWILACNGTNWYDISHAKHV